MQRNMDAGLSWLACQCRGRKIHSSARAVLATALGLAAFTCHADTVLADLTALSFEQLADIRITSVSKKSERVSDAAASVFVITGDDIRHSGATNLPDALRIAPNLQVVQASANGYVVNARGLNSTAANKMLVLIDGRSVYTSLFSGVFWDVQDVVLEDIDRIEVISGPGGTLWGTNAVNGVINIITRQAGETQGGLVSAGAGNRGSETAFRYGGKFAEDGQYRVYGKYGERRHTETASGAAVDDSSHKSQIGFRSDWRRSGDSFTLQGNAYRGAEDQPKPGTIVTGAPFALGMIEFSGINLLSHWERPLAAGGNLSVQAYFDRTERTVPPTFSEKLDVVDLQLQHSLAPKGRHAVVWGAQYRYGMDRVGNSQYIAFLPGDLNQRWSSLFAQDEISLRDDLRLTAGARVEHNDYTGTEFLPNLRLSWKIAPDHLLWSAVSRTVRAPSRLDHDTFVPGNPPFLLTGGPDVKSEIARVLEIGYRGQPTAQSSWSVTAFHARYDDLRTQEIAPSRTSLFFANGMEGSTTGIETWATWQVASNWRLSGGFTALRERLRLKPGSNDVNAVHSAGNDPANTWQLRSSHDLSDRSEFDLTVRHVSALANPVVPSYTAVDMRVGWKPRPDIEISVTGQNLFGGGHGEFTNVATRTQLERSAFVKVLYRY